MAQALTAIKTPTVAITMKARKTVVPLRIRAAAQPPIDVVARNTIGARTMYVVWPGATSFWIIKSAANLSTTMTTNTPPATFVRMSQSPARSDDPTMKGIERQTWPQNQRLAADGDVD